MLNADVISMPDKWEYPWYAAWDLAFHVTAISIVSGNATRTSAAAIHGSASSLRSASASSSHSALVAFEMPATSMRSPRRRWCAPDTSSRRAWKADERDAAIPPATSTTEAAAAAISTARRLPDIDRNDSAGREVEIPKQMHLRFEKDA